MTRFTGRGRSRWILAAAAAALLALVAACGGGGGGDNFGSTQTPQAKGRQGDVYRAPQVQPGPAVTFTADTAWTSYNNATADSNSLYNSYVNTMALASPTWTDADGSVVVDGDVMDGIDQVSTNPQVVRWRIKPGVKWSDGQPWNCKDFYLSYLAQSGKVPGFLPAGTNGYQDIGSAVCTDDNTMVTTFAKPYADYRGLFGQGSGPVILPAHVLEQRTGIPDIRQVTPQSPPDVLAKAVQFWNTGWNGFDKSVDLSSGPYMLDSWVQDQSVTMVRNPQWAGAPGGPERITYRNIADATAEAQALQNNEVQVTAPQVDVNAANLMRGLAAQGVKFQATSGSTYEHLDMNFKNPLFQDKAVRTAFAQCVNRQELVDKLIKGVQPDAAPLQSLIYLPTSRVIRTATRRSRPGTRRSPTRRSPRTGGSRARTASTPRTASGCSSGSATPTCRAGSRPCSWSRPSAPRRACRSSTTTTRTSSTSGSARVTTTSPCSAGSTTRSSPRTSRSTRPAAGRTGRATRTRRSTRS